MTTTSIREYLAETLSVTPTPALAWDEVTRYIRERYIDSRAEAARMEMHRRRHDLYNDAGSEHLATLINAVFRDREVRDLRLAWSAPAQYNNVLKRIVNELSTVFQEPAKRFVAGDDHNAKYREVQALCRQDEQMRCMEQLLNLHRALWCGFRVRNVGTKRAPRNELVIDIVTPEVSFAIAHPTDPTVPIALAIKIDPLYARAAGKEPPAWVVWTEHERFHLDRYGRMVEGTLTEHGIGMLPYVYVTLEPPRGSLWPGRAGEDLVAADMAIKFASVCLLKELKSATKQTVVSGDVTAMARNQAMDTERPIEASEGVAIQTVDMSMDMDTFRGPADHILETVANNYGMSAGLMHHQGVQSAEARDLMRVPLRELRLRNQQPLRVFERRFVEVQAAVLKRDLPELSFAVEEWRIDFADPQTPRSPTETLLELEKARQLGVMSTLEWMQAQNPDLSPEQAEILLRARTAEELLRNELMRPLVAISGSAGAPMPDGATEGGSNANPPDREDLSWVQEFANASE